MFSIDKNKITITKGDSVNLRLDVSTLDGVPYELKDTDVVKLIVRKSSGSNNNLIEKNILDGCFIIEPSDTENIQCGIYMYQVELVTPMGDHYTVVPANKFVITTGF